jgi:iron only hydrogenase large subunit-like protein
MMKDAVKGKYPGYLLEGMACPGGCVAGAGTLVAINKASSAVKRYAKRSPHAVATENLYCDKIDELTAGFEDDTDV